MKQFLVVILLIFSAIQSNAQVETNYYKIRGLSFCARYRISVKNLLNPGQFPTFVVKRRKRPTGKGTYPWGQQSFRVYEPS